MDTPPPIPPQLPVFATPPPPPLPVAAAPVQMGDDFGMRLLLPVGRSGWAIAAGYAGLFALAIVPAPLALILSIIAIRDIRKSKGAAHPKHGMGRAIFGLITGAVGTVALILFLMQGLR